MERGIILNNTYRILKPMGVGGLGEIYLGYHENLKKYVVIKKVKEQGSSLINNRIEVDILKGLHHMYLPQVYDFIELESGIFTVMDYIAGHDLKYYMDNGYVFSEEQLVLWLKQICEVLDYLHTRKPTIIHCDIKPGNIMITEEGNICLIDFNISLDGENNKELIGLSSSFASPEQIRKAEHIMRYGSGAEVKMDERTDIYSLGAVFYYLISGCRPETRSGNVYPLKNMEHFYSEAFVNIVDKAMEIEPSRRFRSATKMLEALEHQERWTSQYQKLWKTGLVLDFSYACIAVVLAGMIFLGFRGMKKEDFFANYESYISRVNLWIDEQNENKLMEEEANKIADEIVNDGISILNKNDYVRLLKKYTDEKEDILYGISQAYLHLENYSEAESFLEELLDEHVNEPEVYRDMAIVKAKKGAISAAEKMTKKAEREGLDEAECNLLRTEIALAEQKYVEAWEYALEATNSTDSSTAQKAAYYVMLIGKEQGNEEKSVKVLSDIASKSNGIIKDIWLRKQGELCLDLYNAGKKMYLNDAVSCFESIYKGGYASKVDLLNLAVSYTEIERYEQSKKILMDMRRNFPNEYKVPMYLAFVIYRSEAELVSGARNYKDIENYYNEAIKICKKQGMNPAKDINMLRLEEIVKQLEEQGWL